MRSKRTLAAVLAGALAALVTPGAEAAFGPFGKDTKLAHMGLDDSHDYNAYEPSVAYNPQADEYLVVWVGDDNTPPVVDGEFEIYAQRLSGAGVKLGGRIRVSFQGPDGDPNWGARHPAVAYNPVAHEYLVVWEGRIATSDAIGTKNEIWGRRLSAASELLGGSDDLQISNTGLEDDNDYDAFNPSVAANAKSGEYLVAWVADDLGVDDEFEITAQRLTAAGEETGGNDFRVSEQGADGNPDSDALEPSVAYNVVSDEYLVVWDGEIGTTDAFDIWAQRLSADGAEVGGNDIRISEFATTQQASSSDPDVAANPKTGDYLVVWAWDHNQNNEEQLEIHGQRLTATGAQTGADDFQISDMDTTNSYQRRSALTPSVAAGAATGEYVVVWNGDDEKTLVNAEFEIFGQRLTVAGKATGADDFRISHMGPDGTSLAQTATPSIAPGGKGNQFLVAWAGNDLKPGMLGSEVEIHGHRLGSHFGPKTSVAITLASNRIPAAGRLRVRVANKNEFAVTGKLTGRLLGRRVVLGAKAIRVAARKRIVVRLSLPKAMRNRLRQDGKLVLRLTLTAKDPVGNARLVRKNVKVGLRR